MNTEFQTFIIQQNDDLIEILTAVFQDKLNGLEKSMQKKITLLVEEVKLLRSELEKKTANTPSADQAEEVKLLRSELVKKPNTPSADQHFKTRKLKGIVVLDCGKNDITELEDLGSLYLNKKPTKPSTIYTHKNKIVSFRPCGNGLNFIIKSDSPTHKTSTTELSDYENPFEDLREMQERYRISHEKNIYKETGDLAFRRKRMIPAGTPNSPIQAKNKDRANSELATDRMTSKLSDSENLLADFKKILERKRELYEESEDEETGDSDSGINDTVVSVNSAESLTNSIFDELKEFQRRNINIGMNLWNWNQMN
ncbi:hypothetical protein M422DRAFT_49006 [Sphaerobolus stellatus SS14]|uniref:Uncharacterized protein n=1 Tax=Sphaerobolus stellatus (strain SS14) TaxID=990650 RepID=A0A0C9UCH2_SPHS4|nr:hypothetical protein M422DRAFT_49006 [Sphaerobolus stellatus SS14]